MKRVYRSRWGSESSRSSIESDYVSILSENVPIERKQSIIENLTKDIVQGSIIKQNKEENMSSHISKNDEVIYNCLNLYNILFMIILSIVQIYWNYENFILVF